jgi:hypothetical protein
MVTGCPQSRGSGPEAQDTHSGPGLNYPVVLTLAYDLWDDLPRISSSGSRALVDALS